MGAVMLVVAALAVTIVGVGLAAWYGGENHASASTVTVTGGSSQPARRPRHPPIPRSPPGRTTSSASPATSATAIRARAASRPTCRR